MKRLGNIWEKICDKENIREAHRHAKKDKMHYDAVKKVEENLEETLDNISLMLKNHTYKVGNYTTKLICDKGKQRILYKLPYNPDRIVQWAIMLQIEKTFNEVIMPFSFASLPNRGLHAANALAQKHINSFPNGEDYCLQIDIYKFYPSINQSILKELLRKKFKDKDLLLELDKIIDSFNNIDISNFDLDPEIKNLYNKNGYGVPIGSYLSQYLANYYLSYFDHWLCEYCGVRKIVRYMDDIIIFSDNKNYLHNLCCAIKIYLKEKLDLILKPNYKICAIKAGITFVGYRHFPGYILVTKSTKKRFIKKLKKVNIDSLNYSKWCSVISAASWLPYANTWKLIEKYITPINGAINAFYDWGSDMPKTAPHYCTYRFQLIDKLKKKYKQIHTKYYCRGGI